jgi:hypothetical protein
MPTRRNLNAGDIIPQMGFAPTQNQNGGWTASRSYYMLAETWESEATQIRFKRGESIQVADPSVDSVYSFLAIESKSASYEDSGTVLVAVNYTGVSGTAFGGENGDELSLEALPTYRLDGRLRDMPITEHPKWREMDSEDGSNINSSWALEKVLNGEAELRWDLLAAGNWLEDEGGRYFVELKAAPLFSDEEEDVEWEEDGLAHGWATIIHRGITTYLSPTLTWTETTQSNIPMTGQEIKKLGQVELQGLIRGNPPVVGERIGEYEWLMTSATQDQRGELYQTTIEWSLSEKGGWNRRLYDLTED